MAAYAKIMEEKRNRPNYPFGHEIAAIYRDPSNTPLKATVPADGPIHFKVKADKDAAKRPPPKMMENNPLEPPKPRTKR